MPTTFKHAAGDVRIAEVDRLATAREIEVLPRRADGSPGRPVPIWIVRVGADMYVRSWRGADGGWYRAAVAQGTGRVRAAGIDVSVRFERAPADAEDAVDAAYREKYGAHSSYVEPMVSHVARATTLRLVPDGAL